MHKFVTTYMYEKMCQYMCIYIHVPCKVEAPSSYGWWLDGR